MITDSDRQALSQTAPRGRKIVSPHASRPATLLLSNGRYSVMLTAAGSGYSRWADLALTRWREDATRDNVGSYIYLRDAPSGAFWSAGYQPTGVEPDEHAVRFDEDGAEFLRRDGTLTTKLEVAVLAEGDGEVRRVTIANAGAETREIEITSYAELALGPQGADVAHQVFAKLFIETEYIPELGVLLATRRKRAPSEPDIWAAHLSVVEGDSVGEPQFETDRARFLGRGRGVEAPVAMRERELGNSVGDVLDPIFALRRRVRIAPGESVGVSFWTFAAKTRAAVLEAIERARTTTPAQRGHAGVAPEEAALFQRLAGHVLFVGPDLRPASETIRRGSGPQSMLWSQGVSGDLPIVLARIASFKDTDFARQLLKAHDFWRTKPFATDLVILNENVSSDTPDLQDLLEAELSARPSSPALGGAFAFRADGMPAEARGALFAAARVVLDAAEGDLATQLDRAEEASPSKRLIWKTASPSRRTQPPPPAPENLEFFNGLGGFGAEGKEYVSILGPGQSTPAPWVNVVANPAFGFQTSAEGGGYTWAVNSREFQLTAWSNDPVGDPPGEVFYLRDRQSGDLWSPTALPIRDPRATYVARHGRGYCRFEHVADGVASELLQFVPATGSVKISRLRLTNTTDRPCALEVTAYVEWVLAASRAASTGFVETEIDDATGAIFARNPWHLSFGSQAAFVDMGGEQEEMTGDRREFLGRNGSLARPAALVGDAPLSGRVGAALDPCAALRRIVELLPGEAKDVVLFLGAAATREEARAAILQVRSADLDALLAEARAVWEDALGAVQVKTPDRSTDIMLNGWLLYQALACRVWARSGFYQASGAYGFRDQLQDGMSLTMARPDLTREHLLRAAARQFLEGDVQHWWLPESGRGVRTRISDGRIWLAYTVVQYIEATGDASVLDESVPFVEGPLLKPDEVDNFFAPKISEKHATLFEHCAFALDISLKVGRHGLPLIGTGDWNDGMNRVGEKGEGESVWLGWFLHATLSAFAPIAAARGERERAETWTRHAEALKTALEREAWDGDWYVRGFFDDGTPFGDAASEECRIDAIAQSWAVLSKAAAPERAERAMAALDRHLIRRDDGLALLFTPPFDHTTHDPGYIKGYPPGVRENGGQYTHAATWSVFAFAALGDGDKAAELFAMLNPINHARTPADADRYKVEPYVIAADIYSVAPHVGRGGWTWYTGSAGWLQRAGIESILGIRPRGASVEIDPCIPKGWPGFEATIRHRSSRYRIRVENSGKVSRGVVSCELDGVAISDRPARAPLVDDGRLHDVVVRLG